MKAKIKFENTVVIIDSVFYNFIVTDIKNHFETRLNRTLDVIDLPNLITFLALDMGLSEGGNVAQLLWLYNKEETQLKFTNPNHLKNELDGQAFCNDLGEFLMASVSTESIVSVGELYTEVFQMALESETVEKIALIADYKSYGEELYKLIGQKDKQNKKKELILFNMGEAKTIKDIRKEILAYPLMQSLGIRAEDLKE